VDIFSTYKIKKRVAAQQQISFVGGGRAATSLYILFLGNKSASTPEK
jgi:hypothetical protein